MKKIIVIAIVVLFSEFSYGQNWALIKDAVSPTNEIPLEFDSIYRQPLSTLGWEDGLHISKDGLHLYCTYAPIDLLSFVLNGDLPNNFSPQYLRGAPTFGMDLITNPLGASEWLHADILYSHRNSITDSFSLWTLSNMARSLYSEGAPAPTFIDNSNMVEFMLFTSNESTNNNTDIWIIYNTATNPIGVGGPMPSPINTLYNEDNPNLIRIDNTNLVLFFDSDNLPGGIGGFDMWYSTSNDNGSTWRVPSNVSSLNTVGKEHQPFLHQDVTTGYWFLYYSAHQTDGQLAIFRAQQITINDWNSWGTPEIVISAGNSAGIGDPTLTKNGDISFVVVYKDLVSNSIYNHFDADPWFLQKKDTSTGVDETVRINNVNIYPNPTNGLINIKSEQLIKRVKVYDRVGKLCLVSESTNFHINELLSGIYYLTIHFESGRTELKKLIKQ